MFENEINDGTALATEAPDVPEHEGREESIAQPSDRESGVLSIANETEKESVNEAGSAKGENRKRKDEQTFDDLEICEHVKKAVSDAGYQTPTPIQLQIIPHMLSGRDILAQSQTGTGKTAAFALPILSRLNQRPKSPQVLVLTPTRELAIQVAKSFSAYGSHVVDFRVAAIYGGQDYEPQLKQLRRGVNVVVGTPGRVIDHIQRGTLDLSRLQCLVLDEADEMLNMGFLEDVEFVLEHSPSGRQIALFSATLPPPIRKISERYLRNPAKVTIKKKTMTADSIRQRAVFVSPRDKVNLLIKFLEAENADGVIVFTRTREGSNSVAEQLHKAGLSAVALNGDMPQKTRERTVERLKAGHLDVLVATDVAARGLDVSRISHVINFDLPDGSESYIHRVGRTGRAGRDGEAIIFLTRSQNGRLRMIERATKQKIEIVDPPTAEEINAMRIERFKKKIDETISQADTSLFQKMIGEYAETSGQPMELIAAAVAFMGQKGQSFLMEKDRKKKNQRDDRARGKRGRNDRFSDEGFGRYRLSVGKRDGVTPGQIVGAIANEAGLDSGDIGAIRLHHSYSTVDLPEDLSTDILELLQETRVSGRELKIRPSRDGHPNRHGKGARQERGRRKVRGKKRSDRDHIGHAIKSADEKPKTSSERDHFSKRRSGKNHHEVYRPGFENRPDSNDRRDGTGKKKIRKLKSKAGRKSRGSATNVFGKRKRGK